MPRRRSTSSPAREQDPYRSAGERPAEPRPIGAADVEWVPGSKRAPDPAVARMLLAGDRARAPQRSPWAIRLVTLPLTGAAYAFRGAFGSAAWAVIGLGLLTLGVFELRRIWRQTSPDL